MNTHCNKKTIAAILGCALLAQSFTVHASDATRSSYFQSFTNLFAGIKLPSVTLPSMNFASFQSATPTKEQAQVGIFSAIGLLLGKSVINAYKREADYKTVSRAEKLKQQTLARQHTEIYELPERLQAEAQSKIALKKEELASKQAILENLQEDSRVLEGESFFLNFRLGTEKTKLHIRQMQATSQRDSLAVKRIKERIANTEKQQQAVRDDYTTTKSSLDEQAQALTKEIENLTSGIKILQQPIALNSFFRRQKQLKQKHAQEQAAQDKTLWGAQQRLGLPQVGMYPVKTQPIKSTDALPQIRVLSSFFRNKQHKTKRFEVHKNADALPQTRVMNPEFLQ